MASTYSDSLRLELMATGDQSGTWGVTTNKNLGTLLEQAITGVLSVAQGDVANLTLTSLDGLTDQARNAVVDLTGAMSANRNVVVPTANKVYLVKNSTSGGFVVTVKTAAGTGVTIPNGTARWVYCDGTNVVDALSGPWTPSSNDAQALGASGTAWSDLFLASGGVINWNAGDVTITHSANALAFAGATSGYSFGNVVLPSSNGTIDLGSTTFSWNRLNVTDNNGGINWVDGAGSATVAIAVGGDIMFFASAANGYRFDAVVQPATNDGAALGVSGGAWSDLFLASGGVINWGTSDVTITNSSNALAFAGATNGYSFANGPVVPATDDGAALGTASTAWSDLFLASGAAINIAANNWVATHTSGILTVGTGDLRVTTAGTNTASVVTVGGAQTLTGKTLTSPVLNTATVGTSLLPSSDDGAALGASGTAFSDLFLASGGVVNWNAGNVTITNSGSNALAITSAGTLSLSLRGTGGTLLEIGRVDGTSSTPVIDFHSGATAIDYDSRLIASGGTGALGGGSLRVSAADYGPTINDATSLGVSGTAWSDLFLASGAVINFNAGNLTMTHSAGALAITGVTTVASATATPANGSTAARLLFGTTAGFGIYYGSGAPTVSAGLGSWYMRSDGSGVNDRMYINTNGSTTWTAVVTVA